jgi:3-phosphoshikimate 1-carboxyvinyltransferase
MPFLPGCQEDSSTPEIGRKAAWYTGAVAKHAVHPAKRINGGVEPPGDKSISHRYAMLAALAEGTSKLRHFSSAADCQSTLDCLRALGAEVKHDRDKVQIAGKGLRGLRGGWRALDAGNSGTTMRLLAGILSGQNFSSKLTGDASLRRRPMRRVVEPLRQMGAKIRAQKDNFAPLEIRGGDLRAIEYAMPMASAQVKSAVLLAGLFAEGTTSVTEPARTRDHTELALETFGAHVEKRGRTVRIEGCGPENEGALLEARTLDVPGDLSSAMFFIAAALLLPESNLLVHNAGLNPTRTAVLDFLVSMGGAIRILSPLVANGEITGDIAVRGSELTGGVIEGEQVALLIDELPMLAALGPFTAEGIEIRDAAELRVKESDRIAAVAENLRRMGARVEERPDGLRVEGREAGKLHGAEIEPHGDHRIAMAFAVAALASEGATQIRGAECAGVSYPEFFREMERLAER